MKSILSKRFAVDFTTASVLFALIVSCSYVSLANVSKPIGEISISGSSATDGKTVTVNGEAVKTGRTIFDSSVISTPAGQTATVNLGRAGKLQISPDSTFVLRVSGDSVSGNLTSGSLTVLGASSPVSVLNANGETISVASGESVSATSAAASKKAQTGPGGVDWWVWAAIVAGAATAVVLIVTLNDDDDVTSPVR